MKYVFFKLFCLLNLIACTKLYAVSKNSLEFKKEQTYLIQINDDDIQSQLFEQLQSQLKGETKQNNDTIVKGNTEEKKQDPSDDLKSFFADQNSISNENLNTNNNLETNEIKQNTEIINNETQDNNDNLSKKIDEEIENKNSHTDQSAIPNLSDNLSNVNEELNRESEKLEIKKSESPKETIIQDNNFPTPDLLNKDNFDSIKIPDISTINPNTSPAIEQKEIEKNTTHDQNNDLLSLLNKKQEESLKETNKEKIKIEQKKDEPGSKSFSDKIKGLFGSDKEKKVESIEIPDLNNKKKEVKKETIEKSKVQSPKKQVTKKVLHKKIPDDDIDIMDLENVRMDNEYEYKVYEYNKKPSNFNDYKVVAKVPEFLEKAHDTFGNGHISRIYSQDDYIDTLFKAIDDEAIGAIDRIFQILRTNDVTRNDGETPLIYAVKKNKIRSLEYLLMRGADKNAKNKKGETAYKVAVQNNNYEIIGILKQN